MPKRTHRYDNVELEDKLSIQAIADIYKVSKKTIFRWFKEGKLRGREIWHYIKRED